MKHDAGILTLNELKWEAGLAKAITISSMNNNNTKSVLDDVIQSEVGKEQKLYSREDIIDFVNVFLARAKREVTMQNHKQSLGSDPLNNNGLPGGSKHGNQLLMSF